MELAFGLGFGGGGLLLGLWVGCLARREPEREEVDVDRCEHGIDIDNAWWKCETCRFAFMDCGPKTMRSTMIVDQKPEPDPGKFYVTVSKKPPKTDTIEQAATTPLNPQLKTEQEKMLDERKFWPAGLFSPLGLGAGFVFDSASKAVEDAKDEGWILRDVERRFDHLGHVESKIECWVRPFPWRQA